MPDVKVFHGGTMLRSEPGEREPRVITDGGRVLSVTALGDDLAAARSRAYEAVKAIRFTGARFRTDIAKKGISAKKS
jgi:phosphoribosylamine--glycine ligase